MYPSREELLALRNRITDLENRMDYIAEMNAQDEEWAIGLRDLSYSEEELTYIVPEDIYKPADVDKAIAKAKKELSLLEEETDTR